MAKRKTRPTRARQPLSPPARLYISHLPLERLAEADISGYTWMHITPEALADVQRQYQAMRHLAIQAEAMGAEIERMDAHINHLETQLSQQTAELTRLQKIEQRLKRRNKNRLLEMEA